jgi:tyrosine-protein phosphatase SIW14
MKAAPARPSLRSLPAVLLLVACGGPGAGCSRAQGPTPGVVGGQTDAGAPVRFARRLPGVRGVAYAAEVAPGLYRGGTPDQAGVAWLQQQLGVRTVINLRHYHGTTEGERVRAAGMRYERIELESSDAPEPQQIERFLALVADPAARPLYVHCLHGVDRTGVMMAVYRMEVEGWSNADAVAEMEHFGPHAIWRDLQRFVRAYRPRRPPSP